MKNTIEDFKAHVIKTTDESEIDAFCFTWLQLLCMDSGKDGERASVLLNVVKDLLGV